MQNFALILFVMKKTEERFSTNIITQISATLPCILLNQLTCILI